VIEQSVEGIVIDHREYETLMKRLGYGHKVDDTSRRLIEDIWAKLSQDQLVKLSHLFDFLCQIHNYIVESSGQQRWLSDTQVKYHLLTIKRAQMMTEQLKGAAAPGLTRPVIQLDVSLPSGRQELLKIYEDDNLEELVNDLSLKHGKAL
jgi:hypothetical protein